MEGEHQERRESPTFTATVLYSLDRLMDVACNMGFQGVYEDALDNCWMAIPSRYKKRNESYPSYDPKTIGEGKKLRTFEQSWDAAEAMRTGNKDRDREDGTSRRRVMEKRRLLSDMHDAMRLYLIEQATMFQSWLELSKEAKDEPKGDA